MSGWRLNSGGAIDRSHTLNFTWEGRAYTGHPGDTLASALLANGVDIIGRSFKYHRPRGLLGAGLEETNAIIQLEDGANTIPNLKATQVELYEGLSAGPVNTWPSAKFDALSILSVFKRFIPAAFYYKTFMWPDWHLFEPSIRKAAGLGKAPVGRDADNYEQRFAHVDTLIVGGGDAGVTAAIEAAQHGAEVMLVETEAVLPGKAHAKLDTLTNVTVMTRTMAFGYYDHNLVGLCERLTDHLPLQQRSGARQRLWKLRADKVVLATGAFERPLTFPNNDLPGVMLASAALTYCWRYGVVPGRRLVIATNNDSAYKTAFALHDAGVAIAAIIDQRSDIDAACKAGVAARQLTLHLATQIDRAIGGRCVKAVRTTGATHIKIICDALLVSGGWNPAVHLHSQAGGSLDYDDKLQAFLPAYIAQSATSVGAATGDFDFTAVAPLAAFPANPKDAQSSWLDFQNDVTLGDVDLATRENFRSVEHVKRYTTLGMASDQGKTSNVSAIHALSAILNLPPQKIGTTKFRPPYDPVTIGAFAGHHVAENFMPMRQTAAYDAQILHGGVMENYGAWLRPAYYAKHNETEQAAVTREVLAVRKGAGLFEASPLGKIEVRGPDAAEFLNRIYVNTIKTLKVGSCRYGLMLNENGIIYDDGVVARLADDHFLVGTTSGHAGAIADILQEWLQCEWVDLQVLTENVTTNWAVMNIAGPKARAILQTLDSDIDWSAEGFPHMTYRQGTLMGAAVRVQRVSFTGELSYEIAIPWGYGKALWHALMAAGAPYNITPFGVEALMVMRIEKGFLHVGSDTDGMTQPQDVGFGSIAARKVGDFVGRRSTMRSDSLRAGRRQFVGLAASDSKDALVAGAHVMAADAITPTQSQGYVTSSAFSPTLNQPVALALIENGQSRIGEAVKIWHMGNWRTAKIVTPGAYDPQGDRING